MEVDDSGPLPGFRFYPTDEELITFYLRRKVENKRISVELIKQADIYKFDPWDLPKSNSIGDNEWYFFCKRGRKYRNSIRPNRVTGSGFWKATGIDKPVYSSGGDFIGLKKSLVFYRGSAGKGTKTDWMMHEFRLPPSPSHDKITKNNVDTERIAQEAEVWTLCRILKRNTSHRKPCTPDLTEMAAKTSINDINPVDESNSRTCISFSAPSLGQNKNHKPDFSHVENSAKQETLGVDELLRYEDWEDIRSLVDPFAAAGGYTNPFCM